ncbi:MAG TPA: hypothetical protein VGV89_00860, partial [Thermoplasmata archaeon]|nr:hypothetical protein [Thermoplasmata archaeon]
MTTMGTNPPDRRPRGRSLLPALIAGLVVVLVLVAVAPPRLSVSADHGRWSGADQWTNGVIVASFVPDRP